MSNTVTALKDLTGEYCLLCASCKKKIFEGDKVMVLPGNKDVVAVCLACAGTDKLQGQQN